MTSNVKYDLDKLKDSLVEEELYSGETQYLFDELEKVLNKEK